MLTSAVVGLLVGTGPCAPRCSLCGARCAPPHLSAGGGWMLTAVRGGSDDSCGESEALPALVNPFAPPLWVGETRELRLRSGEEYEALLSSRATTRGTFAFTTARSCVGSLLTEARCLSLSLSDEDNGAIGRALVIGCGRLKVDSLSGARPFLRVSGVRVADAASETRGDAAGGDAAGGDGDRDPNGGEPTERLAAAGGSEGEISSSLPTMERVASLWHLAVDMSTRVRQHQVASKLTHLGGEASAALLRISESDQRDLAKVSGELRRGSRASGASGEVGRTIYEVLEEGCTFEEQLDRALAPILDQGDAPDLRDAPDSRDADLGAIPAVGVARFAGAEALSLASFVALRLASGGAESAHALAHGCTRSEARWELVEEALEGALAQLRAKLSLVSLFDSQNSDGG